MDIKDITKALSTEFRPGDPEHFRLGVWYDGDTLETSSIKISRDLDSNKTFIDILDKKGTGKGNISDINKLKKKFNVLRKYLPPGDYELNADHPTKAKKYIRDFLKEPGFQLSGEKGAAKVLNKKTGKLEHKSFDTLIMTVPKNKKAAETVKVGNTTYRKVADRVEARKLALEHLKTGAKDLTGAADYILPDGTKIRVRGSKGGGIENVKSLSGLKAEDAGVRGKATLKRNINEIYPGQVIKDNMPVELKTAIADFNSEFDNWAKQLDGVDDKVIAKYKSELLAELTAQHGKVAKSNKLKGPRSFSTGHTKPVAAGGANSPRSTYLQRGKSTSTAVGNFADQHKTLTHGATQLAVGDPSTSANKMKNWKQDFLIWQDRPENGGTGALPQRGDYTPKQEAEFRALSNATDADGKPLSYEAKTALVDEKIGKLDNSAKIRIPTKGIGRGSRVVRGVAKRAGKFIPGISTGITATQATNALQIAARNPTFANKTWAALRVAEAGLDSAGLAAQASLIGAPLGFAAEIGSLIIGFGTDAAQAIHKGGFQVKNTDLSKRTTKTGKPISNIRRITGAFDDVEDLSKLL